MDRGSEPHAGLGLKVHAPLSPSNGARAVTGEPASPERLRDLVLLRRVRDRIDREYAQPLDVEALARDAHMSAGHFSRAFRAAYGESPYAYLMTRRIERAMTLLRRGRPERHRGLLRRWLHVARHIQHPLHRAGRYLAERLPARLCTSDGGTATVRRKAGHQTDQESRSAADEPHLA